MMINPHLNSNLVISKVPRASRSFQMSILGSIDNRFQKLVESKCASEKQKMQHIFKSKEILLDMRHILLYQTFDYDIRKNLMNRVECILSYIHAFMNAMENARTETQSNMLVA